MTDKPSSRTRTDKHCDGVRLFGEVWRSGEMEDSVSPMRRWEDLETDILVKIFQSFDVFELTSGIAHVCSGWRLACCDPLLWKTLDLSMMKSNFIKIPLEPYVYVDGRSDKLLTRLLKISMSLSRGSITTLIFHFNLYVSDDQLTYTAERCPKLKRLVLPAWNRIKKTGICKAISCWKDLESLTMPSIANPPYFIEEIATNCRNFRELKIMGPCDIFFASTLVAYLPKLKVLSLRCSMLLREALLMILEGLPHLEVLNISHCLLIDISPPPASKRILREIDPFILEKASRLRRFFTCMQDSCLMCQRTKTDEGLLRWYKYEEGLWKEDEDGSSKRRMQEMEDDSDSLVTIGRWNDLDTDILRKIFKYFDYLHYEKPEDVSACQVSALVHSSAVCRAWGSVLCDHLLWNTLDLSNMKSDFIRTIQPPYIHVNSRSDEAFSLVLKASLSLSRRNITTLIFHPQLYVSDDQLVYTATRCPNLKRLVLPGGNRIKKTGFCEAIRNWKDLESLTIPGLMHPPSIIEEISGNCRNLSELKIMGCFGVRFASTLVGAHLPNLKVLSLRCSLIIRDALITLLDDLAQLEVLNISHCVLLSEPPRPHQPLQIVQELDEVILERASRLQRFITCKQIEQYCIMCQRATFYEGNVKWYKYEEGLWKQDEVKSLAV